MQRHMQLVPLNVTDGSPEITFQVSSIFAKRSSCIFYEMDMWDTCMLILKYQQEVKKKKKILDRLYLAGVYPTIQQVF